MFRDRRDAGQQLGERLERLGVHADVVLGLVRGGVPVAAEVAARLGARLEPLVVRKIGAPGQAELGLGALAEGGERLLNPELIALVGASAEALAHIEASERELLEQRARRVRADRPTSDLSGRAVLVVDDGLATGLTIRVACRYARSHGAARVGVAVPVAAPQALDSIVEADSVFALDAPLWFGAIGQFYQDFRQTSDDEVCAILDAAG